MFSVSPVSYEHPRRGRPFVSSAEKLKINHSDHYFAFESRVSTIEDSLARMESSMSQRIDALSSRLEKVSDLSIASSRAVAAISVQFEEFKSEFQTKILSVSTVPSNFHQSVECMRDDLLVDVRQMVRSTGNAEILERIEAKQSKLESEQRGIVKLLESELNDMNRDMSNMAHKIEGNLELVATFSEEMRLVAEGTCGDMLSKVEGRLDDRISHIESTSSRQYAMSQDKLALIESKLSDSISTNQDRNELLSTFVNEQIVSLRTHLSQLEKRVGSSDSSFEQFRVDIRSEMSGFKSSLESLVEHTLSPSPGPILSHVNQLNNLLTEMNTSTIPNIYREMETRMSVFEFRAENKTIELMKELCTEMESDISRVIELVHSVYVQAGLPMPNGTLSSWKRFREVMFEKENIGPGFVGRRPILGDAILGHMQNKKSPGRPTSITRYRP
jgi:hypothetical protein